MNSIILSIDEKDFSALQQTLESELSGIATFQIAPHKAEGEVRSLEGAFKLFMELDPKMQAALIAGLVSIFGITVKSIHATLALIVNTRLKRFEIKENSRNKEEDRKLTEKEIDLKEEELNWKKQNAPDLNVKAVDGMNQKTAEIGVMVRTLNYHREIPKGASPKDTLDFFSEILQLPEEVELIEFFED